jgi:hypothetical protein
MAQQCDTHSHHSHRHGPGCGHSSIEHEGHTDYLHDGHMHNLHGDHVDDHVIAVSTSNPAEHTPGHDCAGHPVKHQHGPGCGHESVPHGDHTDYVVGGHLHHQSSGQCNDHGAVNVTKAA